jgi:hypothetical protein
MTNYLSSAFSYVSNPTTGQHFTRIFNCFRKKFSISAVAMRMLPFVRFVFINLTAELCLIDESVEKEPVTGNHELSFGKPSTCPGCVSAIHLTH